jgi:hypothetical protein
MGLFDWIAGLVGGDRAREPASDGGTRAAAGEDPSEPTDAAPTGVGAVVGDCPAAFREEADDLAAYHSGYDLDYGLGSLSRLDEFAASYEETATYVRTETDGGREVSFVPVATGAGCYFGEVLVREHGGEWCDEGGDWSVVVEGPEGRDEVDAFAVAHDCVEGEPRFEERADRAAEAAGLAPDA